MRYVPVVALLLVACVTGPEPKQTCGEYPFVLVGELSSWNAESSADWLLSQSPAWWDYFAESSPVVDFFETGLPVAVERESDRFPVLVRVRYHEDAMWTHREEITC